MGRDDGTRAATPLGPRWTCARCGRRERTARGLPAGWRRTSYEAGGFAVYCGACTEAMRAAGPVSEAA
jgi:hypothetical protein